MPISKVDISKILVNTKYRLPVNKFDVAVHVVDIPLASQKILDLIKPTDMTDMTDTNVIINEFFAYAMMVSDDSHSVCCLVQEGTGNTIETSKLVERWFPYSPLKAIIGDAIIEDGFVYPPNLFKVKITENKFMAKIKYVFYKHKETLEIVELFKKPEYFKDTDISLIDTKY